MSPESIGFIGIIVLIVLIFMRIWIGAAMAFIGFLGYGYLTGWEYAIVIGVPMEWDLVMSNPQFGTSSDGYDRVTTAAIRLEGLIKNLGYAARSHTPNTNYDLIVPPHAVEAGLGEIGRTGFCILRKRAATAAWPLLPQIYRLPSTIPSITA